MPPRKPSPISLSTGHMDRPPLKYDPVKRTAASIAEELANERKKSKRKTAVAERALNSFRDKSGDRQSQGPTPERLLKAGGAARVQKFAESAPVAGTFDEGKFESVDVTLARVVLSDDGPIARLRGRGQLAPGDKDLNSALGEAAKMLQREWARAGRETVKAIDTTRQFIDGGSGVLAMEAAMDASIGYRASVDAIPDDFRLAVIGVVIDERETADVGRQISGYRDQGMATAVCMFALRRGLKALARDRYGLIQIEEKAEA